MMLVHWSALLFSLTAVAVLNGQVAPPVVNSSQVR